MTKPPGDSFGKPDADHAEPFTPEVLIDTRPPVGFISRTAAARSVRQNGTPGGKCNHLAKHMTMFPPVEPWTRCRDTNVRGARLPPKHFRTPCAVCPAQYSPRQKFSADAGTRSRH